MSKFNKIYEFDYHLFGQVRKSRPIFRYKKSLDCSSHNNKYLFSSHLTSTLLQNVTVTMTSVSGHLLGLEFKAPFQKWYVQTQILIFCLFRDLKQYWQHNIFPAGTVAILFCYLTQRLKSIVRITWHRSRYLLLFFLQKFKNRCVVYECMNKSMSYKSVANIVNIFSTCFYYLAQ